MKKQIREYFILGVAYLLLCLVGNFLAVVGIMGGPVIVLMDSYGTLLTLSLTSVIGFFYLNNKLNRIERRL